MQIFLHNLAKCLVGLFPEAFLLSVADGTVKLFPSEVSVMMVITAFLLYCPVHMVFI